jgi:hypothetical protein
MAKGKLVDTWIYEYKGIADPVDPDAEEQPPQHVEAKKVSIELRLIKNYADSEKPPLATKDVTFQVTCKEADIDLWGSDIEALRCAVWGLLDKRFEVKWETYYLVEVQPSNPYEGIGTGLTFGYDTVEKGTAWDGTLLLKRYVRYGSRTEILPWPERFRTKAGKTIATIPATDKNRAAMKEFRDRIDELRDKLAAFLKPENIERTIEQLSHAQFLRLGNGEEDQ